MAKRSSNPGLTALDIVVEDEEHRTVVRLLGEIDAATSAKLRSALVECVDRDRDVVVDLAGVRFIDSSGLGVLVGALRRATTAGRRLSLRSPTPSLQRVLDMTGLTGVFPAEDAPATGS